jgi:hypothetical protein
VPTAGGSARLSVRRRRRTSALSIN